MHAYSHTHTYTHTRTHTPKHTHTHSSSALATCTHTHTHPTIQHTHHYTTHTHTRARTHTLAPTHAHTHAHRHICIRTRARTHTNAQVSADPHLEPGRKAYLIQNIMVSKYIVAQQRRMELEQKDEGKAKGAEDNAGVPCGYAPCALWVGGWVGVRVWVSACEWVGGRDCVFASVRACVCVCATHATLLEAIWQVVKSVC